MRSYMFGDPPLSHPVTLNDDGRARAFAQTQDVLSKLNEIRKRLELPPESMPSVIGTFLVQCQSVAIEQEYERRQEGLQRLPMKIVSLDREGQPMRIGLNARRDVIVRPQWHAYRVESIEIEGNPQHWKVHSIKVGNREQSIMSLEMPYSGELFRKDGPMGSLKLETLQTAMDFTLNVEYVGPDPDGALFEATAVGMAAI